MGLGALLFPALGGYLFLVLCHAMRHRVQQQPGYHLVFASAVVGALLFALGLAIAIALDLGSNSRVAAVLGHVSVDPRFGTAASATGLSFVLGLLCAAVGNLLCSKDAADRSAAERSGRMREVLLHDAMKAGELVEVSLRTGKSYVAMVLRIVGPQPRDSDVALAPILSGYRHPETRELYLTTPYSPLLGDPPDPDRLSELRVVVPISEIVSVRPFDLGVHRKFLRLRSGDSQA